MTKEATVIHSDGSGYATVRVKRESACSHACQSCGGCNSFLTARAANPLGAAAGDKVFIGSSTKKVMRAAVVVYALPALLMLSAAVLCACLGMTERLCALFSFGALGIGGLFSVCFGRIKKNAPEYTIIKIESASVSGGNE